MRRAFARLELAGVAALVSTVAAPALAALKEAKPPDEEAAWLNWAVTLVLAAACALVAFKNAKRSHQD